MNESISRAAGTLHGQETSPARMMELIASADRTPRQRTTAYGEVSDAFVAGPAADLLASFDHLPYTEDSHGRYYAYRITE